MNTRARRSLRTSARLAPVAVALLALGACAVEHSSPPPSPELQAQDGTSGATTTSAVPTAAAVMMTITVPSSATPSPDGVRPVNASWKKFAPMSAVAVVPVIGHAGTELVITPDPNDASAPPSVGIRGPTTGLLDAQGRATISWGDGGVYMAPGLPAAPQAIDPEVLSMIQAPLAFLLDVHASTTGGAQVSLRAHGDEAFFRVTNVPDALLTVGVDRDTQGGLTPTVTGTLNVRGGIPATAFDAGGRATAVLRSEGVTLLAGPAAYQPATALAGATFLFDLSRQPGDGVRGTVVLAPGADIAVAGQGTSATAPGATLHVISSSGGAGASAAIAVIDGDFPLDEQGRGHVLVKLDADGGVEMDAMPLPSDMRFGRIPQHHYDFGRDMMAEGGTQKCYFANDLLIDPITGAPYDASVYGRLEVCESLTGGGSSVDQSHTVHVTLPASTQYFWRLYDQNHPALPNLATLSVAKFAKDVNGKRTIVDDTQNYGAQIFRHSAAIHQVTTVVAEANGNLISADVEYTSPIVGLKGRPVDAARLMLVDPNDTPLSLNDMQARLGMSRALTGWPGLGLAYSTSIADCGRKYSSYSRSSWAPGLAVEVGLVVAVAVVGVGAVIGGVAFGLPLVGAGIGAGTVGAFVGGWLQTTLTDTTDKGNEYAAKCANAVLCPKEGNAALGSYVTLDGGDGEHYQCCDGWDSYEIFTNSCVPSCNGAPPRVIPGSHQSKVCLTCSDGPNDVSPDKGHPSLRSSVEVLTDLEAPRCPCGNTTFPTAIELPKPLSPLAVNLDKARALDVCCGGSSCEESTGMNGCIVFMDEVEVNDMVTGWAVSVPPHCAPAQSCKVWNDPANKANNDPDNDNDIDVLCLPKNF